MVMTAQGDVPEAKATTLAATRSINNVTKRRLDFGSASDKNSELRRAELGLLLNYAIIPVDDVCERTTTMASERRRTSINNTSFSSIHGIVHRNNDDDDSTGPAHPNSFQGKNRRGKSKTSIRPLTVITTTPTAVQENGRPAVWIEAEAGVGKSYLLENFTTEIRSSYSHRAVTMRGKFEPRAAASEPFAALREAFQDFIQNYLLLSEHDSSRQEWAVGLRDELSPYGAFRLLWRILPEIRPAYASVTSSTTDFQDTESDDGDNNPFGNFNSREYRFERFRVAFRNMIRFTCRQLWNEEQKRNLVLILDDFHWVDPDSMQIVKTLMEDPKKPINFRLVAATRPLDQYPNVLKLYTILTVPTEAASEINSSLRSVAAARRSTTSRVNIDSSRKVSFSSITTYTKVERLRHNDDESHSELCERTIYQRIPNLEMMELSKLSHQQIADLLHALLITSEEYIDDDYLILLLELARIVKERTQGNTFVVIQFLRLLERKHMFVYDQEHHRWNFDVNSISSVEYQSENVSKVVTETLETGSKLRKSALVVAASFGVSQFDVSTIVHASKVVQAEFDISESSDNDFDDPLVVKEQVNHMNEQLAEALEEGFVEKTASGNFRFAHDRIRESAYSLLPEGSSRKEVHLKVGRQLRAWMDTQEERKSWF
jgi:predicted ATPase